MFGNCMASVVQVTGVAIRRVDPAVTSQFPSAPLASHQCRYTKPSSGTGTGHWWEMQLQQIIHEHTTKNSSRNVQVVALVNGCGGFFRFVPGRSTELRSPCTSHPFPIYPSSTVSAHVCSLLCLPSPRRPHLLSLTFCRSFI